VRRLEDERRIPVLPVYVDSPMAAEALRFYTARVSELDPDMRPEEKGVSTFASARFQIVASPQQSKALTASPLTAIIISASGMATGGRVLHHLKHLAPDHRNTILFAGFQAGGTRGAALVAGAKSIKIHGEYVPVRAEVANLHMLSAHADAGEILAWLRTLKEPPRRTFVIHGEPDASDALRHRIEEELGWPCTVPDYRNEVELT